MSKNLEHWNNIYETKGPSEVSWTEDYPSYSIGFIESLSLDKSLPLPNCLDTPFFGLW